MSTFVDFEALKSRAKIGARVDIYAIDMRIVAVDVQRPIVRKRLQLDVTPVLITDTCVHRQATIEHPGFLAQLVAPHRIRAVGLGNIVDREPIKL